jgi:serine/threonine protein phosphatase PrpC
VVTGDRIESVAGAQTDRVYALQGQGFQVAVFSDKGINYTKDVNEDSVIVGTAPLPYVFLADHAGGKGASKKIVGVAGYLATTTLEAAPEQVARGADPRTVLERGFKTAQGKINRFNRLHHRTTATTLVGGVLKDRKFYVGSIGDSQALLISKDGTIKKKTALHSLSEEMYAESRRNSPGDWDVATAMGKGVFSNLTRWLGGERNMAYPDFEAWDIESGDSLVIVSDGVLDANAKNAFAIAEKKWPTQITQEELARLVVSSPSAAQATEAIVHYAKTQMAKVPPADFTGGKPDNVSAVVFRFD